MPIIGVPVRYSLDEDVSLLYVFESVRRTIQQAGGELFLIVPIQDIDYMKTKNSEFPLLTDKEKSKVNSYIDRCDGLFLPGGEKFTPYDRYILEYAIKKDIPTLGVCLSMQMMGCYKEDIELNINDSYINHHLKSGDLCHDVIIDKNSILYNILGKEKIKVNSIHNYHVSENHIYNTVALSEDGVIEAIEHPDATFNIGLQWHPEKNYSVDDNSKLIIDYFINQAKIYHKTKEEDVIEVI